MDVNLAIRKYDGKIRSRRGGPFPVRGAGQPPAGLEVDDWGKCPAMAKLAISGLGKLPKAPGTISYRGDGRIRLLQDRHGRLIGRISTLPEGEVLLPPGATYKIAAQYDRQDQDSPWASPEGNGLSPPAHELATRGRDPNRRRRILESVEA